jgi:hypothetical protein
MTRRLFGLDLTEGRDAEAAQQYWRTLTES